MNETFIIDRSPRLRVVNEAKSTVDRRILDQVWRQVFKVEIVNQVRREVQAEIYGE